MGRRDDARNVVLHDQRDDVSSHADTIRGELLGESPYGTFESAAKAFAALDALLAENQRLREALGRIATPPTWTVNSPSPRMIAREALAGDAE